MNERSLTAEDIEAMARAGGLTVSELCALADVSRTSFYRWKRGEGGCCTTPTCAWSGS